jgi:hypothetical protein
MTRIFLHHKQSPAKSVNKVFETPCKNQSRDNDHPVHTMTGTAYIFIPPPSAPILPVFRPKTEVSILRMG